VSRPAQLRALMTCLLIAWLLGLALAQDAAPAPDPSERAAPALEAPAPEATAQEAPAQDAPAQEARVADLERRMADLEGTVAELRAERDRLQRFVERVVRQEAQFEADRLLLTELRKELPDTRAEAELHLRRLQRLASISDPARLAPLASRMLSTGATYLEWRHDAFESPAERSRAFAETGAHGFPTAFTNFRNAVLLTVSNRLEGLLILIE
jgi:TolA-binding protein